MGWDGFPILDPTQVTTLPLGHPQMALGHPGTLGYFTRPKVRQILHVRSESESVGFTELNDIYFFQKKLILDMPDRVLRFNISR